MVEFVLTENIVGLARSLGSVADCFRFDDDALMPLTPLLQDSSYRIIECSNATLMKEDFVKPNAMQGSQCKGLQTDVGHSSATCILLVNHALIFCFWPTSMFAPTKGDIVQQPGL